MSKTFDLSVTVWTYGIQTSKKKNLASNLNLASRNPRLGEEALSHDPNKVKY